MHQRWRRVCSSSWPEALGLEQAMERAHDQLEAVRAHFEHDTWRLLGGTNVICDNEWVHTRHYALLEFTAPV